MLELIVGFLANKQLNFPTSFKILIIYNSYITDRNFQLVTYFRIGLMVVN